jgi:hypothetical protein
MFSLESAAKFASTRHSVNTARDNTYHVDKIVGWQCTCSRREITSGLQAALPSIGGMCDSHRRLRPQIVAWRECVSKLLATFSQSRDILSGYTQAESVDEMVGAVAETHSVKPKALRSAFWSVLVLLRGATLYAVTMAQLAEDLKQLGAAKNEPAASLPP